MEEIRRIDQRKIEKEAGVESRKRGFISLHPLRGKFFTIKYLLFSTFLSFANTETCWMLCVEALRPDDPRSCQMDVRFQPRLSSGSVVPAKDVWTGCPDTPSDGFVSHG